eukprot:CAMPEP_0196571856 /NCGR_PEP_ID=MMETSP1081-20130531/1984_1 /TAXON_ID=36882 /ORGANISM="Pyramimonas amylifera, Strain CCMP720" /LENGTH=392 /DNA_ID=CAMNT_0041888965 /DNA_START=24 /DNA_END=1199 /DNA_ORIENTATION=-
MLVLCGPPGAGKSFLAKSLTTGPFSSSWMHVNQDTASLQGGQGTRAQCVTAARRALQSGQNVIVDRCNMSVIQRSDFVQLAHQMDCQLEAVVLATATSIYVQRVADRTNHEGKVEGDEGATIVHQISEKFSPPTSKEGFTRVTMCKSEKDVEDAILHYSLYKSSSCLRQGQAQRDQVIKSRINQMEIESSNTSMLAQTARGVISAEGRPLPPCAQHDAEEVALDFTTESSMREKAVNVVTKAKESATVAEKTRPRHPLLLAPDSEEKPPKKFKFFPGCDALEKAIRFPEGTEGVEWYSNSLVVLRDKFPKSRCHWLVLPRVSGLMGLTSLRVEHVPILEDMLAKGEAWAADHAPPGSSVRLGFHALPSMKHLHLHVITQDFSGTGMKKKHHW